MNIEAEAVIRLEVIESLANEHPVCTQDHVPLTIDQRRDEFPDVLVDKRLAATDRNDRRATVVGGLQTLLDGDNLADRALVFAYAPAAGTGEIAGMQRLKHQYERKLFSSGELLLDDVLR